MSHKAAKLGITGLVLALAFGGLLYTSLGESAEYYKHVDEVVVNPAKSAVVSSRSGASDSDITPPSSFDPAS